jgi:DNA-binding LacI/PurR family transcriptional regulator
MLEYLTRTGEPPIFFEMRTPPNPNANKRRMAYIETMERLGYEPHVVKVEGEGWDIEEIGYREGRTVILGKRLASNTVFCSNDRLAIGFLAAAYELGVKVGLGVEYGLRVAGHDNHPIARFTCPKLTTVSHNYSAIATNAVSTMMSLIESGERVANRNITLFDGELIMRASA